MERFDEYVAGLDGNFLLVAAEEEKVLTATAALDSMLGVSIKNGAVWHEVCLDPIPKRADYPVPLRFGTRNWHTLVGVLAVPVRADVGKHQLLQLMVLDPNHPSALTAQFTVDFDVEPTTETDGACVLLAAPSTSRNFAELTRAIYTPDLLRITDHLAARPADTYSLDARVFPANARMRRVTLAMEPGSADDSVELSVTSVTGKEAGKYDNGHSLQDALLQDEQPWVLYEVSTGLLLMVNHAAEALMGYGCEELRDLTDFVLWDDPMRREKWVQHLTAHGAANDFPAVWKHRDGSKLNVVLGARLLRDEDINMVLMHLGAADTNLDEMLPAKLATLVEKLSPHEIDHPWSESSAEIHAALESRLSAIFNASPTPVMVTGPRDEVSANEILDLNPAACSLFECAAETLIGQPVTVIFGDQTEEYVRVRKALAEGKGRLSAFESIVRNSHGENVPVLLENRIFSVGGAINGLWQFTDLREQRTTEAEIRNALRRLEQAQSIGKIGDFRWRPSTRTLEGSRECMRILGLPSGDSQSPWAIPLAVTIDLEQRDLLDALRQLENNHATIQYGFDLTLGNATRRIQASGITESEADGSRCVVGTIQDISDRHAAEQQQRDIEAKFQETQRLESLGMLAGGVAHDFNNLLVGITGNADLALLEPDLPNAVKERIEDVVRASRRAADLTRQLLAYSGKGRFVVEPTDINGVVREISQLLEVTTSKNSVLRYQLDEEIPAIECDVTQIRQVIMNLIVNASEAIFDRQGVVTLSTGVQECTAEYLKSTHLDQELPAGRYVYFEVTDTGMGMDAETIEQVFEPFFSTKFAGRGLGLSAVLGIIKGHGGTLKVYSEVGRGTNMKILLPAAESKPVERQSSKPIIPWVGEGTVLVIDDEFTVRDLAQRILEPRGFSVLTAKDGEEGLEIFRAMQSDIRLVILDLTMPRMNGEECFWELRQIRPDIKVILISGYNEQEATSSFVGRGLSDFVAKPFVAADLLAAVSNALADT